jgi:hypothetical protein
MQLSAAAPQASDRIWCKQRKAGCLGACFRLVFAWLQSRKFVGRPQDIELQNVQKSPESLLGAQSPDSQAAVKNRQR